MMRRLCFFIACLLLAAFPAHAQQDTGVWVTTQDYVNLRAGPSTGFAVLTQVPPAETLPAVGRSANMRWVQVTYGELVGWISARYLVWSGDIISLPVDGVNPAPFVRRMIVVGVTTRETRLYARQIDPSQQVGTLPVDTEVEVTARMGEGTFFWLQIFYQGQVYWVGSWDIRITDGNYRVLLDVSYMFPYGRLLMRADSDINDNLDSLDAIETIWVLLAEGQAVTCDFVPAYAERGAAASDIARVPIFQPLFNALDTAVQNTNAAISLFEDVCQRSEPLTQAEINRALNNIEEARLNYTLAYALYVSLSGENPLIIINP
jgi:Bacterial SH3 domain